MIMGMVLNDDISRISATKFLCCDGKWQNQEKILMHERRERGFYVCLIEEEHFCSYNI